MHSKVLVRVRRMEIIPSRRGRKEPILAPMKKRPKAKPDANQKAAAFVHGLTGQPAPNGEDLLGSPELQRQLREAKARDAVKRGR